MRLTEVRNLTLFSFLCWYSICASSCSSVEPCRGVSAEGNIGTIVNTPYDEYSPMLYGPGQLLFTSNREGGRSGEFRDSVTMFGDDIYSSEIFGRDFAIPEIVTNPPLNSFANDGAATFYFDRVRESVTMYFSSFVGEEDSGDSDIFTCELRRGAWSDPERVELGINSEYWDAQPTVSADGSILVFASDRPGGYGSVDLWVSFRRDESNWTTPINLGANINSRFDDISPALSTNNELYFATQAYSATRTFDIVMAQPSAPKAWGKPVSLPFPINSQFDELSPALWGDSILFASNRVGGCGGYDLYAMPLCQETLLRGEVLSYFPNRSYESVRITDEEGTFVAELPLTEEGYFETLLQSRKTYTLEYVNPCYDGPPIAQNITTMCEVEPTIVEARLEAPSQAPVSDALLRFEIPFFVTGYYKPSTAENLSDLRLKFAYNLFADDEKTGYIDFPNQEYDEYTGIVDQALTQVVETIATKFAAFLDECSSGSDIVEITVEGYADPRAISPTAQYPGESIRNDEFGVFVPAHTQMNNKILSTLRAYYTALAIQDLLERTTRYDQFRDRVSFRVAGKGALDDDSQGIYGQQRKTNVFVKLGQR